MVIFSNVMGVKAYTEWHYFHHPRQPSCIIALACLFLHADSMQALDLPTIHRNKIPCYPQSRRGGCQDCV